MDTCDIAWLYKDAKKFGLDRYTSIVQGQVNVQCQLGWDIGTVLGSQDPEFISHLESCPDTPMPWPCQDCCSDVTDPNQDVIDDPDNCQCYYLCAGANVQGHECCAPGLVFNPELMICDWPFNVPDCQD